MTKEEQIKDWFIHQFWPAYPSKFCRNGKGSRQQALNSMLKHNPDEDERRRILGNLKAQVLNDKKNPERKWWCIGVTYVNNQMWEDEIESHDEVIPGQVKYCHCGEPTIGSPNNDRLKTCAKHTESHAQRLKMMSILKDIGVATPGQSLQELSESCREYLRQNGGSGKLFNQMISARQPAEPGNQ